MDKNYSTFNCTGRKIDLDGGRSVFVGDTGNEAHPVGIMFCTPDLNKEGETLKTNLCLQMDAAVALVELLYIHPGLLGKMLDRYTSKENESDTKRKVFVDG